MLWAALFYAKLVDEINDEVDDALEIYSEIIITRVLANQQMPKSDIGSNNSFSIIPVDSVYASDNQRIKYYDADIYIPEKGEYEPARILKTIFVNNSGEYFELTVSTPSFEREDLKEAIFNWIVYLFIILICTIIVVSIIVLRKSMRPLYILLNWLDKYSPGRKNRVVPNSTKYKEFYKLNVAAQKAVDRIEEVYEQQKQFIGNASHELQTPLAVMGNRVDLIIDQLNLNEQQLKEMLLLKETIRNTVRLNKNLLLLTKVDNHQFTDNENINISNVVKESITNLQDIYGYKEITVKADIKGEIIVNMNETLAQIIISNLLKNAFIYSSNNSHILIKGDKNYISVINEGDKALEGDLIFNRFYQGAKKEGSSGLGLAIVKAIAKYYNFRVDYSYKNNQHIFSIYLR
jgi:Signal transduction histidine kinase